ncbi:IclR family transcriptional regulator [Castellaniella sp.]|uniref:IclR family transcriptional regulator n=1 Tax=Castellaniella sp. TaxID=1955812 RepID=UPI002AFEA734|nr:IclR family transcriptional regulator [Castellaniella sp.]
MPGFSAGRPIRMSPATEIPGIQSLERGLALFDLLARQEAPCGLSDLARQAGMHRAKAYRYLVSLVRAGWVQQDAHGNYGVGSAMQTLAVTWLSRQDALQLARNAARELAQSLGQTCFVSVWGQAGATAVRVYQPDRAVSVSVAEGAVLGLQSSATGRVFATWGNTPSAPLPLEMQQKIRMDGLAAIEGEHVSGINALSAPVFDGQGRLALALTLVGPASSLLADADSPAAAELWQAARRISETLGCPGL